MEGINFFNLIDHYTKANQCFGVYVSYEFDLNNDDDPLSWKRFVDLIVKEFPDNRHTTILSCIINEEFIIASEGDCWTIFNIVNKEPYYSKVFSIISGRDGLITENT